MTIERGLIGKKLGMTQVFNFNGTLVGVTAIEVGPCVVVQKKTKEKDGYTALQLGFGEKKESRATRPETGHFAKAGVAPQKVLREFRVSEEVVGKYEVGQTIDLENLAIGDVVDISGNSIGKGFAGVFKRYGFHGGKASHGVHEVYRHGGSLGQNMTPGRVMKGKKMAGHQGNKKITIQNVEVVRIFPEDNIIFVKGPIPGAKNSYLTVSPAIKKSK
jgi:large subunit ribosomal protein L3